MSDPTAADHPVGETRPLPAARKPEAAEKPRRLRSFPFGYLLLWLIATISLLLNLVMVRQVLLARAAAQQAVLDAIAILDGLRDRNFTYTVYIDETLPIDTDLPMNETIPVVIDQTLPVDTIVTVPVNAGIFGTIDLDIPIQTTIDVYFEQDIVIDQTFRIRAAVPIQFEVPINLAVSDTPLEATLDDVTVGLESLADQLNAPLIPLRR